MRERWRAGLGLLLSIVLFVVVVALGPGAELQALRRVVGLGPDAERYATPADVAPGGVHSYLRTQPGSDEPVGWDPCREIAYEVNLDGVPGPDDDALALVREAVAEVSAVTGLRFRYEGRTDRRPVWERRFVPVGRDEPALISWADSREVRELRGDVAGVGGAVAVADGVDRRLRYVTGGVTLDVDAWADMRDARDGRELQRALLLHELGHLVGLGHVESRAELMYPSATRMTGFGQGDLNGLVRLGSLPCR